MKKTDMKELLIYLIGGLASCVSVLGGYPFGVAYFMAECMEHLNRKISFAIIAGSMTLILGTEVSLKYICIMITSLALVTIVETVNEVCTREYGAIIIGIMIMFMNFVESITNSNSSIIPGMGTLEGIAGCAASLIFGLLMRLILENFSDKARVIMSGFDKREKLLECAESFTKLSNAFSTLPVYKETLSRDDVDSMIKEMPQRFCTGCENCYVCWENDYENTYRDTYNIFLQVEEQKSNIITESELSKRCGGFEDYVNEIVHIFERTKLNLAWYNRLIENREAVSNQLSATANIMMGCVNDNIDITVEERSLVQKIKRFLNKQFIQVDLINVYRKKNGYIQINIKMFSRIKKCITSKEVAAEISNIYKKNIMPDERSRNVIGQESQVYIFTEDTIFHILTAVERRTKDGEGVSGDNFSFTKNGEGEFVMTLSDGMGSGIQASKESETVIELLEKFFEAGFEKEMALRIINSAMVTGNENGLFSTVDITNFNLYNGICTFLKIGAAYTYIKRNKWVEVIQSTSLPAGVFHALDMDKTCKKMYDGDFVVMVSDGVTDHLPKETRDMAMQKLLLSAQTNNPKELAAYIMNSILAITDNKIMDDMTVLVCGIWEK